MQSGNFFMVWIPWRVFTWTKRTTTLPGDVIWRPESYIQFIIDQSIFMLCMTVYTTYITYVTTHITYMAIYAYEWLYKLRKKSGGKLSHQYFHKLEWKVGLLYFLYFLIYVQGHVYYYCNLNRYYFWNFPGHHFT